jgi:hypothetical protein
MHRLGIYVAGGALVASATGLMIAKVRPGPEAAFTLSDGPVTSEQVVEKLKSDGWSNIVIWHGRGKLHVTGSWDGQAAAITFDPRTGRLRANEDDDDD